MSAGVFTCSELVKVQALAQNHFSDDVRQADITPFSVAAQAVLENQTARLSPVQDPTKDRKLSLIWHQNCDLTVSDCSDQCDITGSEAGSVCKEIELTTCKSVGVKVKEFEFRTNVLSKEEVAARQMAEALKTMDEFWAKQVVAFLVANAGTNALTSPYTVSGTVTNIPAANWTANLMGYFALAMAVNKMSNMYMLSGQNLYISEFNAMKEMANADGKGNAAKMQTFKKYFDLFNVDSIAAAKATFLINPNAVALVTKAYYSAVPQEYKMRNNWQMRSSVASPSLPGVMYDVHYTTECSNDEIYHIWEVRTKGGIFLNPLGCDTGRTGILQFNCV
jgi:hypothetical protein